MRAKPEEQGSSRRTFVKQLAWAPLLFLPAAFEGALLGARMREMPAVRIPHFPFADTLFVPHYPEKSPLDALLGLCVPGTDEYRAEGYAAQISSLLAAWSEELRVNPHRIS